MDIYSKKVYNNSLNERVGNEVRMVYGQEAQAGRETAGQGFVG